MILMIEEVIITSEEVTVVEVGLGLVFTATEDVTVSVAGGATLVVMYDTYRCYGCAILQYNINMAVLHIDIIFCIMC